MKLVQFSIDSHTYLFLNRVVAKEAIRQYHDSGNSLHLMQYAFMVVNCDDNSIVKNRYEFTSVINMLAEYGVEDY